MPLCKLLSPSFLTTGWLGRLGLAGCLLGANTLMRRIEAAPTCSPMPCCPRSAGYSSKYSSSRMWPVVDENSLALAAGGR